MIAAPRLKHKLDELSRLTGKIQALEQSVAQSSATIELIESSKAYKLKTILTKITKRLGVYHQLLVIKYYIKLYFFRAIHQNGFLGVFKTIGVLTRLFVNQSLTFSKLCFTNRPLFYLYFSHSLASLKEIQIEVLHKKLRQPSTKVDIIIPWYGDANVVKLALSLKAFDRKFIQRIIIINDAYPDELKTTRLFQQLSQLNFDKLKLIKNPQNLGFIGTVNRGMKLSKNDVVLLNSDTIPTHNWIDELRLACYSSKKAATATALSNNATIFSLQRFNEPYEDHFPGLTAEALSALAPTHAIPVPTAHGFCMYIRRSILKKFGYFDQKRYGKGYCEENDFSMRVHKAGYINVAATKSYVAHLEGHSFGNKKRLEQLKINYKKLIERYPEYLTFVADCLQTGKLRNFQKAMVFLLSEWKKHHEYILLVNHSNIFSAVGGVERTTFEEITRLQRQKSNHVLLYLYDDEARIFKLLFIKHGVITAALAFEKTSKAFEIFKWILSAFKIRLILINHLMQHSPSYLHYAKIKKIHTLLFVHDYFYLFGTPDLLNYQEFANPTKLKLLNKKDKKQVLHLLMQPEKIIFNSEFTKKVYEKYLGNLTNAVVSYPDQLVN